MSVSCSAIADALVALVAATGPVTSKLDYHALETTASSAAFIKWRDIYLEPSNFGGNYKQTYEYEINCFIKDTGNATLTNERVWSLTDKIITALKVDYTLNDTCDSIQQISGNFNPEQVLTYGNLSYLNFNLRIRAVIL